MRAHPPAASQLCLRHPLTPWNQHLVQANIVELNERGTIRTPKPNATSPVSVREPLDSALRSPPFGNGNHEGAFVRFFPFGHARQCRCWSTHRGAASGTTVFE